jgi:hypothetical protein
MVIKFVPLILLNVQLSGVPIAGGNRLRYLLHESQRQELSGRCEFLYDIFHLYFLPRTSEGRYIPLIPLGLTNLEILFITGHANHVEEYLRTHIKEIPEKIIVATTCFPQNLKKYSKQKQIYVPDINGQYCYYYDGKFYGFRFNPTDSELNFYNSTGDILKRIESGYCLLK